MAEKTLNTRIQQKHDIEANWLKATNFKPIAGEVIIYDVDENYSYPRIKIGDGNTLINELPFAATRPDWNAVEGEEGYIGNKPNVVTSVNGIVPDENGNSQIPTVDVIQFIDASGFGGGIQCNKTVEEAYNTSTGAGVLIVYRRIWVSSNDGNPTDAYTSTIYRKDSKAKTLTIDFNDGRAPIVVDANNNTITLDPNWVAPAEPVTSVNGKTGAVTLTAEDVGAVSTTDFNETIIGLEVNGKVVTYIKGDGSRHSFETQDTDTTYSLATDEVTGLTKLYATIGSAEDGAMTQKAIKTELDKKVGVAVNADTLIFTI